MGSAPDPLRIPSQDHAAAWEQVSAGSSGSPERPTGAFCDFHQSQKPQESASAACMATARTLAGGRSIAPALHPRRPRRPPQHGADESVPARVAGVEARDHKKSDRARRRPPWRGWRRCTGRGRPKAIAATGPTDRSDSCSLSDHLAPRQPLRDPAKKAGLWLWLAIDSPRRSKRGSGDRRPSAQPQQVAADLLARQAEHDPLAAAILLTALSAALAEAYPLAI